MKLVLLVLAVFLSVVFAIPDHHKFSPEMLALEKMSQEELDSKYSQAKAGEIPNGVGYGMTMIEPKDYFANKELMKFAEFIWQGKNFHKINETSAWLDNSVFQLSIIKADVYFGQSWKDGSESIILDYSHFNHDLFGYIRDEIREFAPNKYIGRVYLFTESRPFVLNFALEFEA